MLPATVQHILVPVDFSPYAERAIEAAVALARPTRARLTILHAMMPADSEEELGRLPAALVQRMEDDARQRLAHYAAQAERQGVTCACEVRFGLTDQAILDAMKDLSPDLVVMSTHGRTGFEHVMLGSVTERVLARASRPVFVVPARTP